MEEHNIEVNRIVALSEKLLSKEEILVPHKKDFNNLDDIVFIGIYFLFHKNEIVYVGQSTNCIGRIITHKFQNVKEFDAYRFIEISYNDMALLDILEKKYIKKFNPIYNAQKYKNCSDHQMVNMDSVRIKQKRMESRKMKKHQMYYATKADMLRLFSITK